MARLLVANFLGLNPKNEPMDEPMVLWAWDPTEISPRTLCRGSLTLLARSREAPKATLLNSTSGLPLRVHVSICVYIDPKVPI